MKKGLLLLNLGTPDSPESEDVGRYLKEFLMDKWVIDIAAPLRWFFVHALIVPKRKFASSEAYKKIWTARGSPLSNYLEDLGEQVRKIIEFPVAIGMRYGNPSVHKGFAQLMKAGCDEILVFPLYPQYAESSTRSSQEHCQNIAKVTGFSGQLKFAAPFYEHPGFIESFSENIRPLLSGAEAEHLLLSFHGLPERHIQRLDLSGAHCLKKSSCCEAITTVNKNCYRAQSYQTARLIARQLDLKNYSVGFQSRLGRTPWIKPYTDILYTELAQKGVERLVVACPSFAADCLETLEEVHLRGQESFLAGGGKEFVVAPCLNAQPSWVKTVAAISKQI